LIEENVSAASIYIVIHSSHGVRMKMADLQNGKRYGLQTWISLPFKDYRFVWYAYYIEDNPSICGRLSDPSVLL